MTILIRKATPEDLKLLQSIARETFFETFSAANTEADMQKYLTENLSENRIAAELNHPDSQFFLAFDDAVPVGYLKVNAGPAQTELQDASSLEIERIYVTNDYHGKKVGQLLYEKALEVAAESNAAYLWLGVWEENPRAIRFYEKNGFVAFDKHIFKFGDDFQTDVMMKKMLTTTLHS